MTQLWSVTLLTCHMGSHSVTFHPTQVNTPRLHHNQTGRYSIYRPLNEGGLSKPMLRVQRATAWFTVAIRDSPRATSETRTQSSKPRPRDRKHVGLATFCVTNIFTHAWRSYYIFIFNSPVMVATMKIYKNNLNKLNYEYEQNEKQYQSRLYSKNLAQYIVWLCISI